MDALPWKHYCANLFFCEAIICEQAQCAGVFKASNGMDSSSPLLNDLFGEVNPFL